MVVRSTLGYEVAVIDLAINMLRDYRSVLTGKDALHVAFFGH